VDSSDPKQAAYRGGAAERGQEAGERAGPRVHWPRTLLAKGVAVFACVVAYVVATGIGISVLRSELLRDLQELEAVYQRTEYLTNASAVTTQALLDVTNASYGASDLNLTPTLVAVLETSIDALQKAGTSHPPAADWARRVRSSLATLEQSPARSSWISMREALRGVRAELQGELDTADRRTAELRDDFVRTNTKITGTWILAGGIGLLALGLAVAGFFTQLTRDVRRLEQRAGQIVRGYRGPALDMRRRDELGNLAAAVDRMAADLHDRELRLEMEQVGRAYRDKMMALGALAAGVAHEVNNPLTTIAAQAESLSGTAGESAARAILDDVRRAAAATRRLAAMTALQPDDFEWIDLNDLLRRTVGLMHYDRRYRLVRFETLLQPDVPAVRTVPDRLQQSLSACLAAVAARLSQVGGLATVSSRVAAHEVECEIRGVVQGGQSAGSEAETQGLEEGDRALAIATAIANELGVRIDPASSPGGFSVVLRLPLDGAVQGVQP